MTALLYLLPAYLLCLYLPGYLAARVGAGLRGWRLLGVAPVATVGLVGGVSPLLAELGIGFNAASVLATALLATGALWLLRRWVDDRRGAVAGRSGADLPWPMTGRARALVWAGIAAGALAGILPMLLSIPFLSAPHQGWDSAWHANYAQFIAESGIASPTRSGMLSNWDTGDAGYYPAAYHGVGALLIQATGINGVEAFNVSIIALVAFVVPAAAAASGLWVSGGRPAVAAATAALSTWPSILPFDQLWRPAVPLAFGLVLLVPLLGLIRAALVRPSVAAVCLAALGVVGTVSLHTSMAFLLAYTVPFLLFLSGIPMGSLRVVARRALALVAVVLLACAALAVQLLAALKLTSDTVLGFDWGTQSDVPTAVRATLGYQYGFMDQGPQWVLAALTLVGLIVAVRVRQARWLVPAFVVACVLTVAATALPEGPLRLLTSPWYTDGWRLAAVAGVFGVLLAGLALGTILAAVLRYLATRSKAAASVVAVLAVAGAVLTAVPTVERNQRHMLLGYEPERVGQREGVVSPAEYEGLREVAALNGPDGYVLNDAYDGSVWLYALTGVKPVHPQYQVGALSKRQRLLIDHVQDLASRPDVQRAVRDLNIRYVYVGHDRVANDPTVPPMYDSLAAAPGFEMVVDRPEYRIYAIAGAPS
jgi:hypothetical protein